MKIQRAALMRLHASRARCAEQQQRVRRADAP